MWREVKALLIKGQGLCASGGRGWSNDEGDGRVWVLGVLTQARGNLVDTRSPQEAEGGVTEEGHHGRALPGMEGALVLAQGEVLGSMQAVLDRPMAPFEGEQPFGWAQGGRQAGDPIMQGLFGHAVFAPGALEAEDLGQTGPVQIGGQIGGGDQVAHLVLPPMAAVPGGGFAPVSQGDRPQGGGWVEEEAAIGKEGGLVLLDQEQIVPPAASTWAHRWS